jgi:hypothetical protein
MSARHRQGQPLRLREDVGQRLPPDDHSGKPIEHRQGHERPEDPRAGEPAVDLDVQGLDAAPASLSSARSIPRCRPRSSTRRRTRCRSSRSPSSTRCRRTARCPTTSGTASGSSPTAAPGTPAGRPADDRREAHQRSRRAGSAPTSSAERDLQADLAVQGPDLQQDRTRRLPRQAARGRLLQGMEGRSARKPGPARGSRRQARLSCAPIRRIMTPRKRPMDQAGHHSRPAARASAGPVRADRRRRRSKPAGLLVLAEIVVLFAGVIARYVFTRPLVWSDELASILFLWLAMLGAVVALRRGEHMRMTALVSRSARGRAPCSRRWRSRLPRLPGADHRPAFEYAEEEASSSRRRWRSRMPGARRRCRSASG